MIAGLLTLLCFVLVLAGAVAFAALLCAIGSRITTGHW